MKDKYIVRRIFGGDPVVKSYKEGRKPFFESRATSAPKGGPMPRMNS